MTAPQRIRLAPARTSLWLVALLLLLAATGWWWTVGEMQGMDAGPWTALGTVGWFLGVWIVMTAAMMFPSVWPTVTLYARLASRESPLSPLAFAAGYLVAWSAVGLATFSFAAAAGALTGDVLAWHRGGRWLAGVTILGAAAYELTPLKDACLGRCRSPLGFLVAEWREGTRGALRMGAVHGAWCVGCCWALMTSLFALGVMSVARMAFVAGLIAFEKLIPWRRIATAGTAAVLVVLGVLVLSAPHAIPWLTLDRTASTHTAR